MESDLDPITPEERELIKQLRKDVADLELEGYFDSDIFYVKWIRAREWQLDRAEQMLRKSIAWRKENDIDSILKWQAPCSIPIDYPIEVCGFNKLGSPIVVVPFAFWDVRKGVEAGLSCDMIRYIDQCLEIMEDAIRKQSTPERPVTQIDIIFDMNSLSFWQLASMKTIELILEIVRRYEANHPELLHHAHVVNASRIFYMLFNIVKPFLAPRTLSKVCIYTANQSVWGPEILKDCDRHQIPKHFGGTGRTSIAIYRDDKRSLQRLLRNGDENENQEQLTTININPGEKVLLTFDIEEPNSILMWGFHSDHQPIDFSVYREGKSEDPKMPNTRCHSWFVKTEGEITCRTPGQYIAEFNNSFCDRGITKTIHYNFKLVKPKKV